MDNLNAKKCTGYTICKYIRNIQNRRFAMIFEGRGREGGGGRGGEREVKRIPITSALVSKSSICMQMRIVL